MSSGTEPLPAPVLTRSASGVVDVDGGLPPAFYADRTTLRSLGKIGQYRALGGTLVEFRFPSARYIYELRRLEGSAEEFRLEQLFQEPYDEHSAAVLLELGGIPGRDPRGRGR